MVPYGLCIYCGRERPHDRPTVACQHCGNTAEGVRWWPTVAGGRDPSGVVLGVLLVVVLAGSVASAVMRAAGEAWTELGIITVVTLSIVWPLLRRLFRREPGTWAFATLDGERIGTAVWDSGRLFWAFGVRTTGTRIEVPDYAKVITAAAAHTAGVHTLGPGVCLALKIDEAAYDDRFSERSLAPMIAAALVGMAAREGCALHWQQGWRFTTFTSPNLTAHQRMVLTSGAAPREGEWFEHRLVEVIERAEAENASAWRIPSEGARAGTAHYRAMGATAMTRFCSLDDMLRDLIESPTLREDCVENIAADPANAPAAAMAFRAFAASHPEVVGHMIETFVDQ